MSRLSSELDIAQKKIHNLEQAEKSMIEKLQQSINDHSMILDRSMHSNLDDLK
jgi:hypothetical protein